MSADSDGNIFRVRTPEVCKCKRFVEYIGDRQPKFHRDQVVWSTEDRYRPEGIITRIYQDPNCLDEVLYSVDGGDGWSEIALTATDPNAKPECCSCPCHNKETE
jgi:hypothetical protein